jgi:uncharacterized protein
MGTGLERWTEPRKETDMKDLVSFIAKHLVDSPNDVSVTEFREGHTLLLELRVEKKDVGKVIGREGKMADALRTILNAVSAKENRRAVLEIIEER